MRVKSPAPSPASLQNVAGLSNAPAQEYVWGRNRQERRRNKKLSRDNNAQAATLKKLASKNTGG